VNPLTDPVLAINSGSSTLKFGLFVAGDGDDRALLRGSAEGIGKDGGKLEILDGDGKPLHSDSGKHSSQTEALEHVTQAMAALGVARPVAVGHRIVHGGPKLRDHVRVSPEVLKTLQAAIHFAPLHIPTSIELIRSAQSIYPDLPQFACFDTAFHQTLPEEAYRFALPKEFFDEGVRRYGFHGLSYASIVHQLGASLRPRTVIAHLGNGSSLAAVLDGRSVDTSMGLTPTGGIPMGTRCGDLDPGVMLYLMRVHKLDAKALETMLNRKSGLVALGGASDMRQLQRSADGGDHAAALAIDIFCRAIARTVAAFAVSLGGLDGLVFAGGIGEHSSSVRGNVCSRLKLLGAEIDASRNDASADILSAGASGVEVRIVPAQEEMQIAREVRGLLAS
jgi:acetate kinase